MAEPEDKPDEDAAIARLLRASGSREQPSQTLERHVRAAVHAEWRAVVAHRGRARQRIWAAAAASLLALIGGLWIMQTRLAAPGATVARVSRLGGTVSAQVPSPFSFVTNDRWSTVSWRQQIHARESVRTGRDGRAALTVAGNVSLRLDYDTCVTFIAPDRIEVRKGAVYVDAAAASLASRLLFLDTPAGSVRHLGTQYEVRLLPAGTRIRVREGSVELSDRSGVTEHLLAGEQLVVTPDGTHRRGAAQSQDVEWNWTAEVAPPFEIEGRPLQEFLKWVARETGRKLVFADRATELEAAKAILHGSVAGLSPDEAFQAVLPTTRLRGGPFEGELRVESPR